MAYIKKTFITGNVIEIEKVYSIRYKGKRAQRGPKVNPTPEAMKEVNEKNCHKKLRRILNTNFDGRSYHATITYYASNRPEDAEQAKKDIAKFWRTLKRRCANVKYVAVAEHTKNGNIHFHAIIKADELSTAEIAACWGLGGVYFRNLDPDGDYDALAWYLLKETKNTYHDKDRRVFGKRWCESKNLVHVEPIVEIIQAESWQETPKPVKGYYVLKDSVTSGVSMITGWPYQYYRMLRLTPVQAKKIAKRGTDGKNKINTDFATKRKPLLQKRDA